MWIYSDSVWTWIQGDIFDPDSVLGTILPVFGQRGKYSMDTHPGTRGYPSYWKTSDGLFWIFGGSSVPYCYKEFWIYNSSINMWAWVGGASTPLADNGYIPERGQEVSILTGSRLSPLLSVSKDGSSGYLYGGGSYPPTQTGDPFITSWADLWILNTTYLDLNTTVETYPSQDNGFIEKNSDGGIVAAIIVPIVAILAIGFAAIFYFYRRKNRYLKRLIL